MLAENTMSFSSMPAKSSSSGAPTEPGTGPGKSSGLPGVDARAPSSMGSLTVATQKQQRGDQKPKEIRVAVIGAGIAGLHVAERLQQMSNTIVSESGAGGSSSSSLSSRRMPKVSVIVMEKSNGYGGRLATRYTRTPDPTGYQFDIGAPFFRIKSEQFRSWLEDTCGLGKSPEQNLELIRSTTSRERSNVAPAVPRMFTSSPSDTSSPPSRQTSALLQRGAQRWGLESDHEPRWGTLHQNPELPDAITCSSGNNTTRFEQDSTGALDVGAAGPGAVPGGGSPGGAAARRGGSSKSPTEDDRTAGGTRRNRAIGIDIARGGSACSQPPGRQLPTQMSTGSARLAQVFSACYDHRDAAEEAARSSFSVAEWTSAKYPLVCDCCTNGLEDVEYERSLFTRLAAVKGTRAWKEQKHAPPTTGADSVSSLGGRSTMSGGASSTTMGESQSGGDDSSTGNNTSTTASGRRGEHQMKLKYTSRRERDANKATSRDGFGSHGGNKTTAPSARSTAATSTLSGATSTYTNPLQTPTLSSSTGDISPGSTRQNLGRQDNDIDPSVEAMSGGEAEAERAVGAADDRWHQSGETESPTTRANASPGKSPGTGPTGSFEPPQRRGTNPRSSSFGQLQEQAEQFSSPSGAGAAAAGNRTAPQQSGGAPAPGNAWTVAKLNANLGISRDEVHPSGVGAPKEFSSEQMYGQTGSERQWGSGVFVGWSKMSSIGKMLAHNAALDVRLGCRVGTIERVNMKNVHPTDLGWPSSAPGPGAHADSNVGEQGTQPDLVELAPNPEVQLTPDFARGTSSDIDIEAADRKKMQQHFSPIQPDRVRKPPPPLYQPSAPGDSKWLLRKCQSSRAVYNPVTNPAQGYASKHAFDYVVVTLPGPQTVQLVENLPIMDRFGKQIQQRSKMRGCFVLMLGFSVPEFLSSVEIPSAVDCVAHPVIRCVVIDSNKPGRGQQKNRIGLRAVSVCVYASYNWSEQHFSMEEAIGSAGTGTYRAKNVLQPLLQEAKTLLLSSSVIVPAGHSRPEISFWKYMFQMKRLEYTDLHAWRYAQTAQPNKKTLRQTDTETCWLDTEQNLGICGDWCAACATVEGAWWSADQLADQMQSSIASQFGSPIDGPGSARPADPDPGCRISDSNAGAGAGPRGTSINQAAL
mmetsp:Transcript_27471/g.69272  ORF Transcript_27471/g.69272 Transcript_27471/m.69272 type:complete len:1147 (-) Transcript_27471:2696-6136(-)